MASLRASLKASWAARWRKRCELGLLGESGGQFTRLARWRTLRQWWALFGGVHCLRAIWRPPAKRATGKTTRRQDAKTARRRARRLDGEGESGGQLSGPHRLPFRWTGEENCRHRASGQCLCVAYSCLVQASRAAFDLS